MNGLILAAIKYRKISLVITTLLCFYGLYTYYFLPKQENPDTSIPVAVVIAVYPGASPTDVESLVTKKLEEVASEIDGLDHIHSYSRNSVSVLVVFLDIDADIDKSWDDLRRRLDEVQEELPEQVERPELKTDLGDTAGVVIALSGNQYSYDQLAAFAEEFEKEVSKVDGVARVEIVGKVKKEVKIEADIARLAQHRLSLEDLLNLLKMQNLSIPSGYIEKDGVKVNVSTPGTFQSLKEIEDTIVDISRETGAIVRLKDVATVSMGLERGVQKIHQDGENAVLLVAYFKKNQNVILIGDDVRQVLDHVKSRLPERLKVTEVIYQPEEVGDSLRSFISNLLQGVALVVLTVFIGMGWRNAVVVSVALPGSILLTFVVMGQMDIYVHSIATAALIIAVGMLVDNAIVISDAVQVRLDEGQAPMDAAFNAAKDMAVPVGTATLTTVASYAPLLMIPGVAGEFAEALPMVVIISLLCSYVVAMLVTPPMASLVFRPSTSKWAKEFALKPFFVGACKWGMRHPAWTILIAFSTAGLTYLLQSIMGLQFFPHAAKPYSHLEFYSEISDIDRTERMGRDAEAFLATVPEITSYTTGIGEGLPKFYITVGQASQDDSYGQILFHFDLSKGTRFKEQEELGFFLQENLSRILSGGTVSVKMLELADAAPAPITLRVAGEDLDRIDEVVGAIKAGIQEVPGTVDVSDDSPHRSLELKVNMDPDIATQMGVTRYDVERQINIALYGSKSSVYRVEGKEYDIVVESNIDSIEQLENLVIKSRFSSNRALVKQIARLQLEPALENVTRYKRERSVMVKSQVQPGYSAPEISGQIEREVMPKIDTDGVTVSFDGERERIIKNFGSVFVAAGVAALVVYFILFLQFNSFVQPIIILFTVPLSIVGSFIGLTLYGEPLSFMAMLGMASLIGVVVNNAIYLLDFINKATENGYALIDACIDSVGKRTRPIALTTITTAVGLIPMVYSGIPLFKSMAIALMFGLTTSWLLTMIVIPVVFKLLYSRYYRNQTGVARVEVD